MEEGKLLLVYYVGVANMGQEYVAEYMERISQKIVPSTIDAEVLLIPVQSNDTRVECINPKYITDKDLVRKNRLLLDELNEHLLYQLNELKQNTDDGKHV